MRPHIAWGPMACHAIVMGHAFSKDSAEFDPPHEFYEHVDALLDVLKQAFLAFRFLLSALTWVSPTIF